MINSLSLISTIFLLSLICLVFLKWQIKEKFNIEIKEPIQILNINDVEKDLSIVRKEKKCNNKKVDYRNDTILLSCFKEDKLASFDKYEKYASKIYYRKDGEVVGEVWVTPSHILENLPQITLNGYFLNNLCVKKSFRRQGIARELMNNVINKSKKEGKLHIILHVNSERNPHLVDFYSDLGFKTYITGVGEEGEKFKLMFMPL